MRVFREQCNGVIALEGSGRPLPILKSWRGSSSVFWIKASYPTAGMVFRVGNGDKTGWAASLKMTYHRKRDMWRVYIPARYFIGRYETAYRVVSYDSEGDMHVEGEGILRVCSGIIPDINEDVSFTTFVKFDDGKYRSVSVSEDESGALTFSVGAVSVVSSQFDTLPDSPYAYNRSTGLFYALHGTVDDAGAAVLYVDEEGVEIGEETFVLDEATKLYYRLESVTDEVGVNVLSIER